MQRVKHPPIRNKIDMTDPAQVRAWTKRLRIRADDLKALIEKVGNSVAAVTKEVELDRMSQQPAPQSEPSIPSEAAEPKLAPI
jgi:predicted nucleic acid-binding Zn ribbon protein